MHMHVWSLSAFAAIIFAPGSVPSLLLVVMPSIMTCTVIAARTNVHTYSTYLKYSTASQA
jgi:hypothetical protein